MAEKEAIAIEHEFVPKHELVSDEELEKVLGEFGCGKSSLPKILKKDPAIKYLKPEKGQVIKITRKSETAGISIYYRMII